MNIDFYKGNIKSKSGYYIDQMWKFNDFELETKHDFIQSLFPLKEQGMADSYLLTDEEIYKFKNNLQLKKRVLKSFTLMMNFYGYSFDSKINNKTRLIRTKPIKRTINNYTIGLYSPHNFRRITRIIKFLKMIDLKFYAMIFLLALCRDLNVNSDLKLMVERSGSMKFWRKELDI